MIAKERLQCFDLNVGGEKPTKYFFNLEKRNYNRKSINELRKQDGVEIREEKEILEVIQEFYEDLYSSEMSTSQEQFDLFISNLIFPKLSDEDRRNGRPSDTL